MVVVLGAVVLIVVVIISVNVDATAFIVAVASVICTVRKFVHR